MPFVEFYAAATVSAVWTGVHLIWGGRDVAVPLRSGAGLPDMVRDTAYLCWHMVSVALALMAALFLLGAWVSPHYAVAGTLLAGGFALVGVGLPLAIRQRYAVLPQGWLFVPVVALGLWGIWV